MTKSIYQLLFLGMAVFLLALGGCAKLNQVSPTSVPSSGMFKDTISLNQALTGLYSTLEVENYYGAFYPMFSDLNSDNGISGGYNNTSLDEFGAYSVTSSNIYLQNQYVAIYYTIANANAILAGEAGITQTDSPTIQLLQKVQGQALAIRAMAHFDLLRSFGYHWDTTSIYGIPVVTTVQTANQVVPRSTVAATYSAILGDLQQSATLLGSDASRDPNYINPVTVNALMARVYLYKKDFAHAAFYATQAINDGSYSVMSMDNFPSIYTSKSSRESIFELPFTSENSSYYNPTTYARPDAASTEVLFIASQNLQTFLQSRNGDLRINLLDYNSPNFQPNGRTLKYSSDIAQKDNSAYILRISEMYLIRAESLGRTGGGLSDLNLIRTNRGLPALAPSDVPDDPTFAQAVSDENRSEFNFEGHRYFDLARTGQITNILGVPSTNSCYPIPLQQITATHNAVFQNPGY